MGIVERLRSIADGDADKDAGRAAMEAAALIERMGKVMTFVEWGGRSTALEKCPGCGHSSHIPHDPACKLAACLRDLSQ
mgnify:CR=1 FL=1